MTTPGGVPNLPVGALTLDNLAEKTQDMSGTAMKARAVERFPSIMDGSTGLSPVTDLTPFGVLTRIFAEANSVVANADPADIQGPEDIPQLLLEFIEGLPVVGQFIDLLQAIMGTYGGDDEILLAIQAIFGPIRALLQAVANVASGIIPTPEEVIAGFQNLADIAAGAAASASAAVANLAALVADLLANPAAVLGPLGGAIISGANTLGGLLGGVIGGFGAIFTGWSGQASTATTVAEAVDEASATAESIRASVAGGFTLQTFTASDAAWDVPDELASAVEVYAGAFGGGGRGSNGQAVTGGGTATGGAGSSSGGYSLEKIDPSALASTLAIVVGAGAATVGTDGAASSITSGATVLVASLKNRGLIADPRGYIPSLSLPGGGGKGGNAGSGIGAETGDDGEPVGTTAGGAGGAGAFNGSGSATGSVGSVGVAGQTSNTPMSGGTGGGGGGAAWITGATGHAQAGNGGAGGYPGGGSGGGGGASAANLGTAGGGTAGAAANGMAFLLWR